MSSVVICFVFFIWHGTWNVVLNKGQGSRLITVEQLVMSMITAIALHLAAEWSAITASAVIMLASAVYYINLVHVRFFGHLIAGSQIKQFLTSRETAAVSGAMLLQAAGRLVKKKDLLFVALIAVVLASAFAAGGAPADPLWLWGMLNGLLLLLIALTMKQYRGLRDGSVEPNRFGMFISYYFLSLAERRRLQERDQLLQGFAAEQMAAEDESDDVAPIQDEWFGKFKGMNVILVQLESFQQFLLHREVEGQEITPFLNRLAREHMSFTDIYSQWAKGHTADAELAVLQSLYPLKNEIVNYKHFDKKYYGLPRIVRRFGYEASAYHGYKGDFYNRRTMMKAHGFEKFYSEDDYISVDKASTWMSDFSFFQQSVQKIKTMKKPFFSFLISLTSHYPFKLEEKHWGLNISKAVPDFMSFYYQSVNYTDRALQHFYEGLEEEGLLANTVIALYGDHEGIPAENLPDLYTELGMSQTDFHKSANHLRVAKVPFIIASGDAKRKLSFSSDKIGSTMDVGQTLLHLLGLPRISYGMGENLFNAPEERIIPLTSYPLGSFATRDVLCYAHEGGYVNSVIFNRTTEKIILPISGSNKGGFDYSRQQVLKSEYLIINDLLVSGEQFNEPEWSEAETATFTPGVERILGSVDEEAIVIPISLGLDQAYLIGQNNDLDSLKRLEEYHRKARRKNIRFYSTTDWDVNEQPVYFEDPLYSEIFKNKGYRIELVETVKLSNHLAQLPDHALIIVSAKDDASNQFRPEFAREMAAYGFHQLNQTKYRHSYINLIYKNKGFISLHEEVSELALARLWESSLLVGGIALPFELGVISEGALAGDRSQIVVDGISHGHNSRGLNFVVVNMETCQVVDVFRADTFMTTSVDSGIYKAVIERQPKEGVS
ncbi:hypothetical protein PAECIP111893_05034 [Paenibacillus plantiphilus]|uniref:Sulfatase N-terminal domain-containing protein n=1 Tax=Paenibacillus plantiphilus TaxID=2905650 RepID=A0ABM9CVP7_9BACL|nr:sulfatase-like hydrolase/transferase [Paenibacillus plantiphilus]CAH1223725.1 hypothetical protein PAECIP111893_05034 [Paenibacillus plantiphilus]